MQAILTKVENGLLPDVAELCSPPRTSLGSQHFGLAPGVAMGLRTGWDFTLHRHRQAALECVRRVKPRLIIVSPEWTQFRQLQHLDGRVWNAQGAELLKEAKGHVVSAVQTYREQKKQGRFFLHEHPLTASSWQMPEVRMLSQEKEPSPRWIEELHMKRMIQATNWSTRGME